MNLKNEVDITYNKRRNINKLRKMSFLVFINTIKNQDLKNVLNSIRNKIMKSYVVTMIIKVEDKYNNRKSNKDMIARLIKDKIQPGIIYEKMFRGSVELNIKEIDVVVQEV